MYNSCVADDGKLSFGMRPARVVVMAVQLVASDGGS